MCLKCDSQRILLFEMTCCKNITASTKNSFKRVRIRFLPAEIAIITFMPFTLQNLVFVRASFGSAGGAFLTGFSFEVVIVEKVDQVGSVVPVIERGYRKPAGHRGSKLSEDCLG